MSDDVERLAMDLQREPDQMKLFTPPPWEILAETSREYWRERARKLLPANPA